MKKYKPEFTWDEESRSAICIIKDEKDRVFIGEATCHPDDQDMMSERTGCELAFRRAKLQYLRAVRDAELKPALAALKQLYYSMKHSSNFDEFSYENRMLQRQIRLFEFDLTTVKEMIAYEYQGISDYIKGKDKVYKKIRNKQNGQN